MSNKWRKICPINAVVVQAVYSCAEVDVWMWMLSLEPAMPAAWLDLALPPLPAGPHILETN